MQYSPKLKKAAAEIKKILEEYDINGSVFLHTPGFSEYLHKINASYSCANLKQGELVFDHGTRFTKPDKQMARVRDTLNFLELARITTTATAQNYQMAAKIFHKWARQHYDITHGDAEHTSQDEIDN